MRVADMIEPIGIARSDIYVDGLTPPMGTLPFPLQISIETVAAAKEAGFSTILWPANAALHLSALSLMTVVAFYVATILTRRRLLK